MKIAAGDLFRCHSGQLILIESFDPLGQFEFRLQGAEFSFCGEASGLPKLLRILKAHGLPRLLRGLKAKPV